MGTCFVCFAIVVVGQPIYSPRACLRRGLYAGAVWLKLICQSDGGEGFTDCIVGGGGGGGETDSARV